MLPWVMAGIATLAALALGYVASRHATEEPPRVFKMSVLPPEKTSFSSNNIPAVSPDGRRLAFVAAGTGGGQKPMIWIRDLDSLTARALTGTEEAFEPFWSPDSRSIGFFAAGKLKRIDVAGGPAQTLCAVGGNTYGATWGSRDLIVFTNGSAEALMRVPAAQGECRLPPP